MSLEQFIAVAKQRSDSEYDEALLWFNRIILGYVGRQCIACDFFSPYGSLHIDAWGPCERHPEIGRVSAINHCRFGNGFVHLGNRRTPINAEGRET